MDTTTTATRKLTISFGFRNLRNGDYAVEMRDCHTTITVGVVARFGDEWAARRIGGPSWTTYRATRDEATAAMVAGDFWRSEYWMEAAA